MAFTQDTLPVVGDLVRNAHTGLPATVVYVDTATPGDAEIHVRHAGRTEVTCGFPSAFEPIDADDLAFERRVMANVDRRWRDTARCDVCTGADETVRLCTDPVHNGMAWLCRVCFDARTTSARRMRDASDCEPSTCSLTRCSTGTCERQHLAAHGYDLDDRDGLTSAQPENPHGQGETESQSADKPWRYTVTYGNGVVLHRTDNAAEAITVADKHRDARIVRNY